MITNPIIPIGLMSVICVGLLFCKRKGMIPYIRQVLMILLLFVINLRIMVPDGNVTVKTQKMNTKILFVVDNTISMVAKDDGQRERLELVKEDCAYMLKELNGAKFGVISFNNEAHFVAPFTNNGEYVESVIGAIYPLSASYAKGSSMNIWKITALDVLKSAKEENNGDVALFFISDGEITNQEQLESFAELKQYVDYGAVLGYGTSTGGKMEVKGPFDDEPTVVEDRRKIPAKAAVSCIDEENLKQIAKDIGIEYIHMEKSSDVDGIVNEIKVNGKTESADKKEQGFKDIYFIFVMTFLLLLLYDVYDMRKRAKVI
ncbi:MAG: VWA domain-containing protein [Lachnospiraceae bacterium]